MPDYAGRPLGGAIWSTAKDRAAKRAKLYIRRVDLNKDSRRNSACVVVDKQPAIRLLGAGETCFTIEPGDHLITIFIWEGPLFRREDAIASARITAEPGEVIEMVCGLKTQWRQFAILFRWRQISLLLSGFLVAATGWIFFPLLREVLASAAILFGVEGPFLSWIYLPVRSRLVASCFVSFLWAATAGYLVSCYDHALYERLRARVGSFCFLGRSQGRSGSDTRREDGRT